jgi:hypothetical protein
MVGQRKKEIISKDETGKKTNLVLFENVSKLTSVEIKKFPGASCASSRARGSN